MCILYNNLMIFRIVKAIKCQRIRYAFIIIFITLKNIILIQHLNFIRMIFQLGINLSDLSIRIE